MPVTYNAIVKNPESNLVFLYKNGHIGIYPNHIPTTFKIFRKETNSFYKIIKEDREGWMDIRDFKEYYLD